MALRAAARPPNTTLSAPLGCRPNSAKSGAAVPPAACRPGRRAATLATAFFAGVAPLMDQKNPAGSFEFGITAPDQTVEEAEAGIKIHSRGLLQLRPLVDSRSWRELQLELRESSSRLKQDIYTLIQSSPGEQRPLLRKLYSKLFNNVTRLDYAARSKDANLVQEHITRRLLPRSTRFWEGCKQLKAFQVQEPQGVKSREIASCQLVRHPFPDYTDIG